MANQDQIPAADNEFDTLQSVLIAAVNANATEWEIPTDAITPLTTLQGIWAAAWQIARDKQNATTAQRTAKDLARKNFEKKLRPFIQKWIYRNELMDDAAVQQCGLRPRDTTPTPVQAPATPDNIKVLRGESGVLLPQCGAVDKADYYGCIMIIDRELPENVVLTPQGQLISYAEPDEPKPEAAINQLPGTLVVFAVDLTKGRKKKFTGLMPGMDYYFYFYTVNRGGASGLSEPVTIKCW